MTTPTWNQPTAPQPRKHPKWLTGWRLAVTGSLAVLLVCCGGVATVSLFTDDPGDKKPAATAAPFIAPAPTTTTPETVLTTPPAEELAEPAPTTAKPKPKRSTPKPRATTRRPTPRPVKTTRPPSHAGVHPGAFCSPEGARGTTSKGTAMRCTRKPGEDRARWRKA